MPNIPKEIAEIKEQYGLSDKQVTENITLLGLMGQSDDSFMAQVYTVAIILFFLVLMAGVLMIATFTAEGRKKNCIIKLEEIEKISSVHRGENEDNAHFIKNPHIFTYLHRQQLRRRVNNKQYVHCCDITVTHEDVKAFMAQRDEYAKANRFKNITVKVFI